MKYIDDKEVLSVSELSDVVKRVLLDLPLFWVEGEVSDLRVRKTRFGAPYAYFSLKDEQAVLTCTAWSETYTQIEDMLEEGKRILAKGNFDFYPPSGRISFIVKDAEPFGEGQMLAYIEKLKAKLQKEGLFAPERKKPLPPFPSTIGLITSPDADAYHDFVRFVKERYPYVTIFFAPSKVQGAGAAKEMISQLAVLNKKKVDVIVLTRGGGSLEDLMEFNDEKLARAIAKSTVPVVAAIGHEADVTIADLVADVRAATPTDAGKTVVPDKRDIEEQIVSYMHRMTMRLKSIVRFDRTQTERTIQTLTVSLNRLLPLASSSLQENMRRLSYAFDLQLKEKKTKLVSLRKMLEAVSPLRTLNRGYAVVSSTHRIVVKSVNQVKIEEYIKVRLADGRLLSQVKKKEKL